MLAKASQGRVRGGACAGAQRLFPADDIKPDQKAVRAAVRSIRMAGAGGGIPRSGSWKHVCAISDGCFFEPLLILAMGGVGLIIVLAILLPDLLNSINWLN